MKNPISVILSALLAVLLVSCGASKELRQSNLTIASLREDSTQLSNTVASLQKNVADLTRQVSALSNQNGQLNQQSSTQQNELNMSQQQLQQQQRRLQQLQSLLDRQRAASDSLRARMTAALSGFSTKDLTVTQKNGKVYVSLSENLLFPSASAVVNPRGKEALSKLAVVLNLNPDIAVLIEGHTDSLAIHGRYQDNWDLSTARANSIVRILVDNYKVDPVRVEAAGHSKYDPVDTNGTLEGRARNRRTEIILSPKLDELYRLIGS